MISFRLLRETGESNSLFTKTWYWTHTINWDSVAFVVHTAGLRWKSCMANLTAIPNQFKMWTWTAAFCTKQNVVRSTHIGIINTLGIPICVFYMVEPIPCSHSNRLLRSNDCIIIITLNALCISQFYVPRGCYPWILNL